MAGDPVSTFAIPTLPYFAVTLAVITQSGVIVSIALQTIDLFQRRKDIFSSIHVSSSASGACSFQKYRHYGSTTAVILNGHDAGILGTVSQTASAGRSSGSINAGRPSNSVTSPTCRGFRVCESPPGGFGYVCSSGEIHNLKVVVSSA